MTKLVNEWWKGSRVDKELTRAEVVSLFQKGDTADLENYRPISLLNTIYKIYATILKQRIEEGVEELLHEMQYGFRKNRGTSDAIHCIRRIQEYEEQDYGKCILVLLDWEKHLIKYCTRRCGRL